jgi:hypothetical protein
VRSVNLDALNDCEHLLSAFRREVGRQLGADGYDRGVVGLLDSVSKRLLRFCLRDEQDVLVFAIDVLELQPEDALSATIRADDNPLISTFDQL